MLYRYRMHGYSDPDALPIGGRPLFGREPAEAIAVAASLWSEVVVYSKALGYCVVDTENGKVIWRCERDCGVAEMSLGLLLRATDGHHPGKPPMPVGQPVASV